MRKYITIAVSALLALSASAQNLNPTVQVTNAYEGKLMEVEKQTVPMAIPDSLTQFDWNFNYSVFDNPYKGAYEFNPYLIEMKPDPVKFDGRNLYVRAGAGYSLHPEIHAVWTPSLKGRFGITLYEDFKGFWGQYHTMRGALTNPEAPAGTDYETEVRPNGTAVKGNEIGNRTGVKAVFATKPVVFSFDGQYRWLNTLWDDSMELNNAYGQSYLLNAKSNFSSAFSFDASVRYEGMSNHPQRFDTNPGLEDYVFDKKVHDNDLGGDFLLSYSITNPLSISLAGSYDHFYFKDIAVPDEDYSIADWLNIGPICTYRGERASISAGVKFSDVWKNGDFRDTQETGACYKGRRIFPQLNVSYELVEEALVASAFIKGGQKFNSYASLLETNHFFPAQASHNYYSTLADASVNALDAGISLSGRVKSVFQYKIDGGYARYLNSLVEEVRLDSHIETRYLLNYSLGDYNLLYADFNGSWRSDRIDASALLRVQKMNIKRGFVSVLPEPRFVGSADFTYNWNRRIFAGVSAEWATSRRTGFPEYSPKLNPGNIVTLFVNVPGWVDLGINAEFKVTNKFSLWLKGANLLNMNVMRNFLVVEKGPYVTAGVCLVL